MRLIIFDCDGTLVDSQAIIVAAMADAFADFALPPPGREATLSIVGLSLAEAITVLLPQAERPLIEAVAAAYKGAFAHLRQDPQYRDGLYPGAGETIRMLHERPDVQLGIATGKSRRGVAALLEREGLQGVFSTIQTADDAPSKPHPAMVLQAMMEAAALPAETVMIGDTTYDVEMALAARAHAIGVAWGYHSPDALVAAGSHALVTRFVDLPDAIDTLWSSDGQR